jgi:hypothetical protein
MTNELEKQFFDTFGIEPITQAVWNSTETKWKNFESWEEYPQITDRILLELILIYSQISNLPICYDTVESFKEGVLECFIEDSEDFKHQVRTLFEEG